MMTSNGTERSIGQLQGKFELMDKRQDRMDKRLEDIQSSQSEILAILKEGNGKIASLRDKYHEFDSCLIDVVKKVEKNTEFRNKTMGIASGLGAIAGFVVAGIWKIIELFHKN